AAEAAAQKELLTLLGDLDRLGAPLYEERGQSGGAALRPTEQLVARVAEEVRVARFEARDARREVVVVVDARSAQARSADLVMILGLVEREFPRAPNEDQFLPEATRRALSGRSLPQASGSAPQHLRVPTAADCAAEDRFVFYSAAIGARRELWLLYPGFTAHGAPRTPSRFLADVERLLSVPAQSACTLNRSPGELVSDDPDRLMTLSAARRFAYRYVSAVSRPREAERVPLGLALFERLLRDPYERARIALSLGQPEAKLPPGPAAALERVYSSSELESYATCPYRHFVRYLVAARPVDDLATTGLDALRRGRVVHDALERIYRDGESPRRAFEREFARGVKDLDVGMEEDAFKRQALRAIEAFVSEDDPSFRTCGRLEPWGFELAFGPETESGALEIEARPLGGTITLRGQIDRVDLVGRPEGADGPQEGFVTDYKLGGREVDGKYLDAMHRGNRLQIPLYLLALERVFGVRPLGAAFAALGTRRRTGVVEPEVGASWEPRLDEQRVKLHKVALDRTLARAEDHVRRIVTGIAQGLIEPAPEEAQDCLRCDAQDVCRVDRDEARRIARRGRALPILPPQAFMKRTTPIPQT
ncbi:MAG: PD-(D/E)XK nuclease family protein, partial [Planctomycetes bacterium]|nr:PD-(D/E)XK nuclease family protein [Planctomycetota bacterium]